MKYYVKIIPEGWEKPLIAIVLGLLLIAALVTIAYMGIEPLREKKYCSGGDEYNCEDFATQEQAQKIYELCSDYNDGDINKLDKNSNGVACENNKQAVRRRK